MRLPWPDGYIVLPSMNYEGYALLRSILDMARAVGQCRPDERWPPVQSL
jgi:hypothetical protein